MENTPFQIVVKPEDRIQAQIYYDLIIDYILKKEDVPYELANEFLKLLKAKEDYVFDQISKKAKLISNKAISMLKKRRGYIFSGQSIKSYEEVQELNGVIILPDKPDEESIIKLSVSYSVEDIIHTIARAYLIFRKDKGDKVEKENAIHFYFEALNEYSKLFNSDHSKAFTFYKKAVIAGVLTMCSGYKLTRMSNPTNGKIFEGVRNTLENMDKFGTLLHS